MTALEIVRWLHFVGFTTWLAGLVSLGLLLRANASARPAAVLADLGATLTLISGLYRATSGGFFNQPWLHLKILFVAALLGVHTAMRMRVKRKDGRSAGAMVAVAGVLGLIIIYMVEFRPFAR
jgi:uncharacterized membrane protein